MVRLVCFNVCLRVRSLSRLSIFNKLPGLIVKIVSNKHSLFVFIMVRHKKHMLLQIKAPQFYANVLILISLVMDSSISEVEF